MIKALQWLEQKTGRNFSLKVGIAAGPLVAGWKNLNLSFDKI
jgi:hypothetical protein